jgi:hypothetical protein
MGDSERRRDRWGIYGHAETEPDVRTRFEIAKAYAEMGLLGDAMAELEEVLRVEPGHVGARTEIARLRLGGRSPKSWS